MSDTVVVLSSYLEQSQVYFFCTEKNHACGNFVARHTPWSHCVVYLVRIVSPHLVCHMSIGPSPGYAALVDDWDKKVEPLGPVRVSIPGWIINSKLDDQGGLCACGCNRPIAGAKEVDHWPIPIEKGGTNAYRNLRILRIECHRAATSAQRAGSLDRLVFNFDMSGFRSERKTQSQMLRDCFLTNIERKIQDYDLKRLVVSGLGKMAFIMAHDTRTRTDPVLFEYNGHQYTSPDYSVIIAKQFDMNNCTHSGSSEKQWGREMIAFCDYIEMHERQDTPKYLDLVAQFAFIRNCVERTLQRLNKIR